MDEPKKFTRSGQSTFVFGEKLLLSFSDTQNKTPFIFENLLIGKTIPS